MAAVLAAHADYFDRLARRLHIYRLVSRPLFLAGSRQVRSRQSFLFNPFDPFVLSVNFAHSDLLSSAWKSLSVPANNVCLLVLVWYSVLLSGGRASASHFGLPD
jgi:hypothetical protein